MKDESITSKEFSWLFGLVTKEIDLISAAECDGSDGEQDRKDIDELEKLKKKLDGLNGYKMYIIKGT